MNPSKDRRRMDRSGAERRQHARYALPVGYTQLLVKAPGAEEFAIEGYAYDISTGGLRFELDQPIPAGTPIEMKIMLPGLLHSLRAAERAVIVKATVAWLEDEDEPGPVKMAATFGEFESAADERRLRSQLAGKQYRRAA